MMTTRLALTGAALAAALLLSACGAADTTQSPAAAGTTENTAAADESAHAVVSVKDQWVKAAETGGMTGLFGTLHNSGDRELVIRSVESDAAETVELHEVTADGRMQQIDGDVVIPAGGSYELAPGANHIMLMGVTVPLLAGDDITVTVQFTDGSSIDITAPVKDYAGANESYDDLGGQGEHASGDSGTDHGGH